MKLKVKAIAKMSKMLKNAKDNSDLLLEIKDMSPDGKIPRGLLMKGRPAIKDSFKEFLLARDLDKDNERRPTTNCSSVGSDSLLI